MSKTGHHGRLPQVIGLNAAVLLASPSFANDLFHPLPTTADEALSPAATSNEAASARAQRPRDPTIIRRRQVTLAQNVLAALEDTRGSDVTFNLFDEVSLATTVTQRINRGPDSHVFLGTVRREPGSSFTLVRHRSVVIGNIRVPGLGSFQVRYLADGVHEIREIDESAFPPCATEDAPAPAQALAAPALQAGATCDDDDSVIDVLLVYTEEARIGQGGLDAIEALILLSESETNQAYENSQIGNTRLRIVHMYEVDYLESLSGSTDLTRLMEPDDGYMDEVHDLRDRYAADVVSMFVDDFNVCGIATFSVSKGLVARPDIAFNVTKASCAAGNYTFGHEVGHNQGSQHDRVVDPSDYGAFLYSHGYRNPSATFRTVMAYPPGERIPYFSNPDVLYNGEPTGLPESDPESADNARSIRNTALIVANFRRSKDCNNNGICDDEEISSGTALDCNGNGVPDECDGDCNGNGQADECDIAAGISEDCTGDGIPDECDPDCNFNGVADSCDIAAGVSQDINGNGVADDCEPRVLYVKHDATGAGNGVNWEHAFTNPRLALKVAEHAVGLVEEIWVARGTYTPGPPGGDRYLTFELPPGVGMYGGFAGTETSREQRDPAVNITTLSGDLNGDDGPEFANRGDNAHHVVATVTAHADNSTVLDGFVISGGQATDGTTDGGGGMVIYYGAPTIANCVFTSNEADVGGGIYAYGMSGLIISRCRFVGNRATGAGGALQLQSCEGAEVRNCVFHDNRAPGSPGLSAVSADAVSVSHCTFVDNIYESTTPWGNIYVGTDSRVDCRGCILWNTSGTTDPLVVAAGWDERIAEFSIQNSTVLGGVASIEARTDGVIQIGPGVLDADPLLAPDRIHLLPNSPCADRGSIVTDPSALDIDGEARVRNCVADMGADETDSFSDCNGNAQPDGCEIVSGSSQDINQNFVPDECEEAVSLFVDAAACPNTGTGTALDPFCDIQTAIDSAPPGDGAITTITVADGTYIGDGNRDIDFRGRTILLRSANGPQDCIIDAEGAARVFHIDVEDTLPVVIEGFTITGGSAPTGAGILIERSNPVVRGCRIEDNTADSGGGVYIDGHAPEFVDCVISNNQADAGGGVYGADGNPAFVRCTVSDNNAIQGGGYYFFSINLEPTIRECTIERNAADEGGGLWSRDAFIHLEDSFIRENVADGEVEANGGGIRLRGGGSRITGCLFEANIAASRVGDARGGAMYAENGTVAIIKTRHTIENCTFSRNEIRGYPNQAVQVLGGGLFLRGGYLPLEVNVRNCAFRENVGGSGGGANVGGPGNSVFDRCTFEDNVAQRESGLSYGGGLASNTGDITLVNCVIRRNRSVNGYGGGIDHINGNLSVTQCLLTGNEALERGGGLYRRALYGGVGNSLDITNSTIVGNLSGAEGAGMALYTIDRSDDQLNIANSIVWGNTGGGASDEDDQLFQDCEGACEYSVHHNCIQGWTGAWGGVGNIGDEPNFVDAAGPDGLFGTDDDDVHVHAGSPVIDAGDNAAVPPELVTDLDGNPRFVDDPGAVDTGSGVPPIVDMGIYEGGHDCNGNGVSDLEDIANGTSEDCTGNGFPDECELDCNENGVADSCDIADGTSSDCNGNATPDECDVTAGASPDCNGDLVPDECEPDADGDGAIDDCDACPTDPAKTAPGACGCLVADVDTDGDSVLDCFDICPGYDDLTDTDLDGIPNGCDQCPGFDDTADADGDTVADACDRCPGFDDRQDADADAVPDDCDQCQGYDDRLDCNCNEVPDGCDIVDVTSPDVNDNGVPDECDVLPAPAAESRAVSLNIPPTSFGTQTAVRITVVRMYVDESEDPVAGCPPRTSGTDLSSFDGAVRWLGPPEQFSEDNEPPTATFLAAQLQCCPYFRDWSQESLAVDFSSADVSVVHAYGPAVAPCSEYGVRPMTTNCMAQGASGPGETGRTALWGDLWAPWGLVNFQDIGKVVEKFRSIAYQPGPPEQGAPPKIRAMLRGAVLPLHEKVNFIDIGKAVEAFKRIPFAESGPSTCPPCP